MQHAELPRGGCNAKRGSTSLPRPHANFRRIHSSVALRPDSTHKHAHGMRATSFRLLLVIRHNLWPKSQILLTWTTTDMVSITKVKIFKKTKS
jgi:hypothetical protein